MGSRNVKKEELTRQTRTELVGATPLRGARYLAGWHLQTRFEGGGLSLPLRLKAGLRTGARPRSESRVHAG